MKDVPVLYEDTDILVINKPCGIPVQGGAGISVCITDILARQTGSPVFPVHRLDRDTAGILLVARNAAMASRLTRAVGSKDVIKRYTAICAGKPPRGEGCITLPVGKGRDRKPAETTYRLLEAVDGYSLLQAELGTGRTHQIRIHFASVDCPILADDKYGDFPLNRRVRRDHDIRKLQLAATEIVLPPGFGIPERFSIPLPPHMVDCAAVLGFQLQ